MKKNETLLTFWSLWGRGTGVRAQDYFFFICFSSMCIVWVGLRALRAWSLEFGLSFLYLWQRKTAWQKSARGLLEKPVDNITPHHKKKTRLKTGCYSCGWLVGIYAWFKELLTGTPQCKKPFTWMSISGSTRDHGSVTFHDSFKPTYWPSLFSSLPSCSQPMRI